MPRDVTSLTLRQRILLLTIGTTLTATVSLCVTGFLVLRGTLIEGAHAALAAEVRIFERKLAAAYDGLAVDADFLAGTSDVADALEALSDDPEATPQSSYRARMTRQRLERTFSSFLEARPHLIQARLIERSPVAGELVRVNSEGGGIEVVPPEGLQNKGLEPYMMEALLLWPGERHFSRVTQNRENGVIGDDAPLTLRVVHAVAGADGRTAGFVVLNADFAALLARAIGDVPPDLSVTVETGGRVFAFGAPELAPVSARAGPAGMPIAAPNDAPEAGADGRILSAAREAVLGRNNRVLLRLSKPEAVLMADAHLKLFLFLELAVALMIAGPLVALVLGNRLAGHLTRLTEEVTRSRSNTDNIEIDIGGFHEAQVLGKAFEGAFNRLAEQSRELVWRAGHDQLSGLLNRRGLDDAIRTRLDPERPVSVIQFDLDRFKLVNDTLGHEAGDAVIAAVGIRLRSLWEPGDLMCRMGGDEFLLVRSGADAKALEAFAEEAIPVISAPFAFKNKVCRFGTSMGAADGTHEMLLSGELMRRADHALYRAKNEGRGRFCYFGPEMERRMADRAQIASDLDMALETNQFTVAYMPKVAACDGRLIGLEALVRWQHPTRGILMPQAFLPIAEELKLTGAIDKHVLKLVLRERETWLAQTPDLPTVSVNVSARRLLDPDLVESVRALEIPPGAISFELLESIFLDDASDIVTWSCDTLREMGIGIEIDDFGSGHASILGLTRIRPDWIKIDQALVGTLESEMDEAPVLKAILEMAAAFDIRTVAEGVEKEHQARKLTALGCDALQGYHIGRAVPASDVPALLGGEAAARVGLLPGS